MFSTLLLGLVALLVGFIVLQYVRYKRFSQRCLLLSLPSSSSLLPHRPIVFLVLTKDRFLLVQLGWNFPSVRISQFAQSFCCHAWCSYFLHPLFLLLSFICSPLFFVHCTVSFMLCIIHGFLPDSAIRSSTEL